MGFRKKNFWVLFFVIGLLLLTKLFACKTKEKTTKELVQLTDSLIKETHFNLRITASDLTEDAPIISTKNDELIVAVYSISKQSLNLCFQNYITFQKTPESKEFEFSVHSNLDSLTFIILEMDSENGINQTEPIIRINLNTLEKAFKRGDTSKIKEYLGDDDLLSIQKFSRRDIESEQLLFSIQGSHLFDSYSYQLNLKPIRKNKAVRKY